MININKKISNGMNNYRKFFENKKITVVGLGLLGKRLGDIIFLAECGADLLVTDLKTKEELTRSLDKLKKYTNIKYILGEHRFEDFENRDFILKGQGVPLDSPYIAHAREKGIPIEMDESLFVKLAPGVKIIGVTGTRGKSTTTCLIYEILKNTGMNPSYKLGTKKPQVFLGGNIRGTAALPLLKEVKESDIVVLELSSWQLQGFAEAEISPQISVFTNFMPDHMNYYRKDLGQYFLDKSYIYKFQKEEDILILGPKMQGKCDDAKSKIIDVYTGDIPKSWKINLKGEHNLENIACAIKVGEVLGVKEEVIKKAVENFKTLEGRLELIRNIRGIDIYNDTNASTPEATSVALKALGSTKKNIILILGGSDKQLDFTNLFKDINKYVKAIVLIPGDGTDRIKGGLEKVPLYIEKNLPEIISKAYSLASGGDIILFSPAFASFGMFVNEYDRGEKFVEIVKQLN